MVLRLQGHQELLGERECRGVKKRWDRRSVSSGDSVGEANEALGVLREGRVECLRHRVRRLQHPEQGEEGGRTGARGHPGS